MGDMGGEWDAWRCKGQIYQDPWNMHALLAMKHHAHSSNHAWRCAMHADRFSNVHALSSRRQRGLSISSSPIVHGPSVTPYPFVKPAPLTDSKGAGHCPPSPISSPPAGEPTCCCCWPDCMSTKGVASFSCKFWMTDKQDTSLRVGKRPAMYGSKWWHG